MLRSRGCQSWDWNSRPIIGKSSVQNQSEIAKNVLQVRITAQLLGVQGEYTPKNVRYISKLLYEYIIQLQNKVKRKELKDFLDLVQARLLYVYFFCCRTAEVTKEFIVDAYLKQALVAYITVELKVATEYPYELDYKNALIERVERWLWMIYSKYCYYLEGRIDKEQIYEIILGFLKTVLPPKVSIYFSDVLDTIERFLPLNPSKPQLPYCTQRSKQKLSVIEVVDLTDDSKIDVTQTGSRPKFPRITNKGGNDSVWDRFSRMRSEIATNKRIKKPILKTDLKAGTIICLSDDENNDKTEIRTNSRTSSQQTSFPEYEEDEDFRSTPKTVFRNCFESHNPDDPYREVLNDASTLWSKWSKFRHWTGNNGINIQLKNNKVQVEFIEPTIPEQPMSNMALQWPESCQQPYQGYRELPPNMPVSHTFQMNREYSFGLYNNQPPPSYRWQSNENLAFNYGNNDHVSKYPYGANQATNFALDQGTYQVRSSSRQSQVTKANFVRPNMGETKCFGTKMLELGNVENIEQFEAERRAAQDQTDDAFSNFYCQSKTSFVNNDLDLSEPLRVNNNKSEEKEIEKSLGADLTTAKETVTLDSDSSLKSENRDKSNRELQTTCEEVTKVVTEKSAASPLNKQSFHKKLKYPLTSGDSKRSKTNHENDDILLEEVGEYEGTYQELDENRLLEDSDKEDEAKANKKKGTSDTLKPSCSNANYTNVKQEDILGEKSETDIGAQAKETVSDKSELEDLEKDMSLKLSSIKIISVHVINPSLETEKLPENLSSVEQRDSSDIKDDSSSNCKLSSDNGDITKKYFDENVNKGCATSLEKCAIDIHDPTTSRFPDFHCQANVETNKTQGQDCEAKIETALNSVTENDKNLLVELEPRSLDEAPSSVCANSKILESKPEAPLTNIGYQLMNSLSSIDNLKEGEAVSSNRDSDVYSVRVRYSPDYDKATKVPTSYSKGPDHHPDNQLMTLALAAMVEYKNDDSTVSGDIASHEVSDDSSDFESKMIIDEDPPPVKRHKTKAELKHASDDDVPLERRLKAHANESSSPTKSQRRKSSHGGSTERARSPKTKQASSPSISNRGKKTRPNASAQLDKIRPKAKEKLPNYTAKLRSRSQSTSKEDDQKEASPSLSPTRRKGRPRKNCKSPKMAKQPTEKAKIAIEPPVAEVPSTPPAVKAEPFVPLNLAALHPKKRAVLIMKNHEKLNPGLIETTNRLKERQKSLVPIVKEDDLFAQPFSTDHGWKNWLPPVNVPDTTKDVKKSSNESIKTECDSKIISLPVGLPVSKPTKRKSYKENISEAKTNCSKPMPQSVPEKSLELAKIQIKQETFEQLDNLSESECRITDKKSEYEGALSADATDKVKVSQTKHANVMEKQEQESEEHFLKKSASTGREIPNEKNIIIKVIEEFLLPMEGSKSEAKDQPFAVLTKNSLMPTNEHPDFQKNCFKSTESRPSNEIEADKKSKNDSTHDSVINNTPKSQISIDEYKTVEQHFKDVTPLSEPKTKPECLVTDVNNVIELVKEANSERMLTTTIEKVDQNKEPRSSANENSDEELSEAKIPLEEKAIVMVENVPPITKEVETNREELKSFANEIEEPSATELVLENVSITTKEKTEINKEPLKSFIDDIKVCSATELALENVSTTTKEKAEINKESLKLSVGENLLTTTTEKVVTKLEEPKVEQLKLPSVIKDIEEPQETKIPLQEEEVTFKTREEVEENKNCKLSANENNIEESPATEIYLEKAAEVIVENVAVLSKEEMKTNSFANIEKPPSAKITSEEVNLENLLTKTKKSIEMNKEESVSIQNNEEPPATELHLEKLTEVTVDYVPTISKDIVETHKEESKSPAIVDAIGEAPKTEIPLEKVILENVFLTSKEETDLNKEKLKSSSNMDDNEEASASEISAAKEETETNGDTFKSSTADFQNFESCSNAKTDSVAQNNFKNIEDPSEQHHTNLQQSINDSVTEIQPAIVSTAALCTDLNTCLLIDNQKPLNLVQIKSNKDLDKIEEKSLPTDSSSTQNSSLEIDEHNFEFVDVCDIHSDLSIASHIKISTSDISADECNEETVEVNPIDDVSTDIKLINVEIPMANKETITKLSCHEEISEPGSSTMNEIEIPFISAYESEVIMLADQVINSSTETYELENKVEVVSKSEVKTTGETNKKETSGDSIKGAREQANGKDEEEQQNVKESALNDQIISDKRSKKGRRKKRAERKLVAKVESKEHDDESLLNLCRRSQRGKTNVVKVNLDNNKINKDSNDIKKTAKNSDTVLDQVNVLQKSVDTDQVKTVDSIIREDKVSNETDKKELDKKQGNSTKITFSRTSLKENLIEINQQQITDLPKQDFLKKNHQKIKTKNLLTKDPDEVSKELKKNDEDNKSAKRQEIKVNFRKSETKTVFDNNDIFFKPDLQSQKIDSVKEDLLSKEVRIGESRSDEITGNDVESKQNSKIVKELNLSVADSPKSNLVSDHKSKNKTNSDNNKEKDAKEKLSRSKEKAKDGKIAKEHQKTNVSFKDPSKDKSEEKVNINSKTSKKEKYPLKKEHNKTSDFPEKVSELHQKKDSGERLADKVPKVVNIKENNHSSDAKSKKESLNAEMLSKSQDKPKKNKASEKKDKSDKTKQLKISIDNVLKSDFDKTEKKCLKEAETIDLTKTDVNFKMQINKKLEDILKKEKRSSSKERTNDYKRPKEDNRSSKKKSRRSEEKDSRKESQEDKPKKRHNSKEKELPKFNENEVSEDKLKKKAIKEENTVGDNDKSNKSQTEKKLNREKIDITVEKSYELELLKETQKLSNENGDVKGDLKRSTDERTEDKSRKRASLGDNTLVKESEIRSEKAKKRKSSPQKAEDDDDVSFSRKDITVERVKKGKSGTDKTEIADLCKEVDFELKQERRESRKKLKDEEHIVELVSKNKTKTDFVALQNPNKISEPNKSKKEKRKSDKDNPLESKTFEEAENGKFTDEKWENSKSNSVAEIKGEVLISGKKKCEIVQNIVIKEALESKAKKAKIEKDKHDDEKACENTSDKEQYTNNKVTVTESQSSELCENNFRKRKSDKNKNGPDKISEDVKTQAGQIQKDVHEEPSEQTKNLPDKVFEEQQINTNSELNTVFDNAENRSNESFDNRDGNVIETGEQSENKLNEVKSENSKSKSDTNDVVSKVLENKLKRKKRSRAKASLDTEESEIVDKKSRLVEVGAESSLSIDTTEAVLNKTAKIEEEREARVVDVPSPSVDLESSYKTSELGLNVAVVSKVGNVDQKESETSQLQPVCNNFPSAILPDNNLKLTNVQVVLLDKPTAQPKELIGKKRRSSIKTDLSNENLLEISTTDSKKIKIELSTPTTGVITTSESETINSSCSSGYVTVRNFAMPFLKEDNAIIDWNNRQVAAEIDLAQSANLTDTKNDQFAGLQPKEVSVPYSDYHLTPNGDNFKEFLETSNDLSAEHHPSDTKNIVKNCFLETQFFADNSTENGVLLDFSGVVETVENTHLGNTSEGPIVYTTTGSSSSFTNIYQDSLNRCVTGSGVADFASSYPTTNNDEFLGNFFEGYTTFSSLNRSNVNFADHSYADEIKTDANGKQIQGPSVDEHLLVRPTESVSQVTCFAGSETSQPDFAQRYPANPISAQTGLRVELVNYQNNADTTSKPINSTMNSNLNKIPNNNSNPPIMDKFISAEDEPSKDDLIELTSTNLQINGSDLDHNLGSSWLSNALDLSLDVVDTLEMDSFSIAADASISETGVSDLPQKPHNQVKDISYDIFANSHKSFELFMQGIDNSDMDSSCLPPSEQSAFPITKQLAKVEVQHINADALRDLSSSTGGKGFDSCFFASQTDLLRNSTEPKDKNVTKQETGKSKKEPSHKANTTKTGFKHLSETNAGPETKRNHNKPAEVKVQKTQIAWEVPTRTSTRSKMYPPPRKSDFQRSSPQQVTYNIEPINPGPSEIKKTLRNYSSPKNYPEDRGKLSERDNKDQEAYEISSKTSRKRKTFTSTPSKSTPPLIKSPQERVKKPDAPSTTQDIDSDKSRCFLINNLMTVSGKKPPISSGPSRLNFRNVEKQPQLVPRQELSTDMLFDQVKRIPNSPNFVQNSSKNGTKSSQSLHNSVNKEVTENKSSSNDDKAWHDRVGQILAEYEPYRQSCSIRPK